MPPMTRLQLHIKRWLLSFTVSLPAMTDPAPSPLVFILDADISEAHTDHFIINGFGARIYVANDLSSGDKVKVTIQKVPPCPPSPTTQPDPSSNS